MKRIKSLQYHQALQFALVAALPVLIIVILVWLFLLPAMRSDTQIRHQGMAWSIAGQVSSHVLGGQRQLAALTDFLEIRDGLSDRQLTALLDAQCGEGELFETIYISSPRQQVVKAVGLARSRRSIRQDLLGLDLSGRTFLMEVGRPEKPVWSETFLSTVSRCLAVALTIPLSDNLITAEITLDNLSSVISQLPVEPGFLTYVIDRKGRIVADSRRLNWGQRLNAVLSSLAGPQEDGSFTSGSFELDGKSFLGTVVTIDELGWKVLVAQPAAKAYKSLHTALTMFALGLAIALMLALSLSWNRAKRLSKIFQAYGEKAEAIAGGRYDETWPSSTITELNRMGQSLKHMARMIDQRERALVENEEQLRNLIANVPGVVYQYKVDPDSLTSARMTYIVREKVIEIFGLDFKAETFHNDFVACLPEQDRSRFEISISEAVKAEKPWHYEGPFTKPSGETIWFEGHSVPKRIGGDLIYYGLHADITDRKLAEKALKKSEKRLINLTDNVPGVVIQFRTTRDHVYSNEFLSAKTTDIFGLEPNSVTILDEFYAHIPDEEKEAYAASMHNAIDTVSPWTYEGRFNKPDGETIWFSGHAIPHDEGDTIVYYGILMDITRRKEMEASLRMARFIIDNSPIGIWRMGEGGEILDVNEEGCASLGYTREELGRMRVFDFDPAMDGKRWEQGIDLLQKSGFTTIDSLHRRRNGEIFPIQVVQKMVRFEDQDFRVAFVQDITERKEAEKALRKNEQLLSNILESMNEGLVVLDSEFRYQIFNRQMEKIANTPRQKILGMKIWDAFPFVKGTVIEDRFRRAMGGELIVDMALPFAFPNKKNAWFSVSFIPLKDEDGRIIGVLHVSIDITQKKQDEEELRKLRNYLSNIIDSMPSVIVAVDLNGRVTLWNRHTENITGLSIDQARSKPLADVFPRLAHEMERIKTAIRQRRVISTRKVPVKTKQDTRFEAITIFPLTANGVEGAVIRVDDVTEQVRLEEMMIQGEKMLSVGGLAAGMAHEINNPLAGMMQTAGVMAGRLGTKLDIPANRKAAQEAGTTVEAVARFMELRSIPRMLKTINESGSRVAEIVENMLSFARKSEAAVSSYDLGKLLDKTLELAVTDYDLKKKYDFKRITIEKDYADPPVSVSCEGTKIQQVLLNILRNGAEAMGDIASPRFIFRTRREGNTAVMEIEDNGPGMDEKTRKRIFEPFFTTKPVGVGTGLGLSVSYFIVTENHGGEMDVKSSPGTGATFRVRLPMKGKTVE